MTNSVTEQLLLQLVKGGPSGTAARTAPAWGALSTTPCTRCLCRASAGPSGGGVGPGPAPAPAASASGTQGGMFDWNAPPVRMVPEPPGQGIAGLPGLAVFGAHMSSAHLVMLLGAGLLLGLKGLLVGGVICEYCLSCLYLLLWGCPC